MSGGVYIMVRRDDVDGLNDEMGRLRAENESLHQQLDTVSEAHNVMAKEGDRLRAENAELRQLLQTIAVRLQVAGGAFPTLIDAILAKTAKEGK